MPTTETSKPNPLAVRLDVDDLDWLKTERATNGTPVNALIKKAVKQYRTRIETARRGKAGRGAHS